MARSIMERTVLRFWIRWAVSALGLWIAAALLGGGIRYSGWWVLIVAGLVLAALNTVLKPILVILSLPVIVLTLGLFMIVVNGAVVFLVSWIYPPLHIDGFGAAVVAGIIVGLVNYIVTAVIADV